jgi:hypothetical protein
MFQVGRYSDKAPWRCVNVCASNEFGGVQARSGEFRALMAVDRFE